MPQAPPSGQHPGQRGGLGSIRNPAGFRNQTFVSQTKGVQLSPSKPATELPASTFEGRLIRLPLYCGKHEAFYPAELAQATLRTGWHYTFLAGCECPYGYIIRTEHDGAHMKRWGEPGRSRAGPQVVRQPGTALSTGSPPLPTDSAWARA